MKPGIRTVRAGVARGGMLALALASGGCSYLIGLNGYAVGGDAGTTADGGTKAPDADAASALDGDAEAEASCSGDAGHPCYACPPSTSDQFLNACSNAACVPFDVRRLTNLLPDGSLPPLPPLPGDGGAD